ncbi:MAG: hypothetical protein ACI91B_005143, partial [Planctomycetota bacterium]
MSPSGRGFALLFGIRQDTPWASMLPVVAAGDRLTESTDPDAEIERRSVAEMTESRLLVAACNVDVAKLDVCANGAMRRKLREVVVFFHGGLRHGFVIAIALGPMGELLANTPENPISRTTSTASDLRSPDRRHNDLRAPADCSFIQRTALVGTVADDSTDLALDAIDEVHADVAVINTRINQSLTDDHAIAVDTEVQLLPTTNAL